MTDRGGERPSEFSAPSFLVNEEIPLEAVFERITGNPDGEALVATSATTSPPQRSGVD